MDLNLVIAGEAGQGLQTLEEIIGKALYRQGYNVFSHKDYMSRVRGGHNFSRLRIAPGQPWTTVESTDVLVALNEETYSRHSEKLVSNGRVIYDPQLFSLPAEESRGVPVELKQLAEEAGGRVMANTVAVGALLVLMGYTLSLHDALPFQVGMERKSVV